MSEHMCVEPGLQKKVHWEQDDKERIVDIYVSEESLRVYENPWVPDSPTNIPAREDFQHRVFVAGENPGKRNRAYSVFLGVACLLLLAGILAIIYLGVQMKSERHQLVMDKLNLEKLWEKLTTNITEHCSDGDDLWEKFCRRIRKKCKKCRKSPDSSEDL